MKKTTTLFCLGLILCFGNYEIKGQGCVAIRHFSSCNGNSLQQNMLNSNVWQASMNYRYFKSFRHFRGKHEEPDRITNNTEVVNYSHAWDFSLQYAISSRLYSNLTIPTVINERSSLYEHGRDERNSTFSRGIGDIRLGIGYWLLNPESYRNGNIALGFNLKLPTGNYNYTDIFYNVGPNQESQVRPVDQSIQPGDGGFGFAFDMQFFHSITGNLFVYGNGFYLFNPRNINNIRTFRETLSPLLENEAIMSVPDQLAYRTGLNYTITPELSVSVGYRYECVPVEDILGSSEGFRRPGSVSSIEPGVSFMKNNFNLGIFVPFALVRNRPQSITDIQNELITGQPRNGDAAFADYLINLSVAYQFPKRKKADFNSGFEWQEPAP